VSRNQADILTSCE